jgi:hypothetical protein
MRSVYLVAVVTAGPNLLGLVWLDWFLSRRPAAKRWLRRGLWLPIGAIYTYSEAEVQRETDKLTHLPTGTLRLDILAEGKNRCAWRPGVLRAAVSFLRGGLAGFGQHLLEPLAPVRGERRDA